jgi:hypothetical protein
MSIDLNTATHETFRPFVGSVFSVSAASGPVELTLDNVKLASEATIRDSHVEVDGVVLPPRRAFALTFEGPQTPVLHQGIYPLDHPEIGRLDLFLVPFRQDAVCSLYESVFS